jgi:PAS domain-containing protein
MLLWACGTQPSAYDQFLVPEQQVKDSIQRLVLAPVAVQTEIEVPESVLVRVDSLVEMRLLEAGFTTVPSQVYDELWTRLMEEAGGFYDPYTGERDDARFEAAVDQLKAELRTRFNPDALLYPEIWSVEARNYYGVARWDGMSQNAYRMGEFVRALSLIVIVEDLDGNEVYVNGGGIALTEVFASEAKGVVTASPAKIFEDPDRLDKAVDVALQPFVSGRGS